MRPGDLISRQAAINGIFAEMPGLTLDGVLRVLRHLPSPVVRCRECKYISMTTIGMDYACWHGAESVYGQTGEHAGHVVCQRIESLDHFCAYGERRDPDA